MRLNPFAAFLRRAVCADRLRARRQRAAAKPGRDRGLRFLCSDACHGRRASATPAARRSRKTNARSAPAKALSSTASGRTTPIKPIPPTAVRPATSPNDVLQQTLGVYPAPGLARYEYAKHGTCTGLSPENYFAAVKYARNQIADPGFPAGPSRQADEVARRHRERLHGGQCQSDRRQHGDHLLAWRTRRRAHLPSKDLRAFANCRKVSGHTCNSRSIAVAPLR